MQTLSTLLLFAAALPVEGQAAGNAAAAENVAWFESRVRPLLVAQCQECHGPKKQQGGLRLDTAAGVRAGGDSGPVVVPGKPEQSLLLKAVRHEGPKMPPKQKLKFEEIALLTEWVKRGATFPEAAVRTAAVPQAHWAFQPVADPHVPEVRHAAWPRNAVDRFVLAELEARGLTPVGPAERRTLLRRVTFDLTGLPPTPEEVERFLAEDSADAFARVVDRLLASPHYGERWGRHWLDVVRYADTAGDNSDYPIPQMYLYRNWVIQALNRDKPFDQFLTEQLAGDLLPARDWQDRREKLIATGYVAGARRFGSYEDARYQWHLTYEDAIDNLGRTFLGLTINCARCHDHKFDPIKLEDYYSLYGFFRSTRYPWPGTELSKVPYDLVPLLPPGEAEAALAEHARQKTTWEAAVKRAEEAKAAANKAAGEGKTDEARRRTEEADKALQAARKQRDVFARTALPFETAYAVAEGTRWVGNARMHTRGDPEKLGKEVPRRFLGVLGGQPMPTDEKGSGRLALAGWLTDPANPLTTRVFVNRLWHYHFGKGLVATPSDFGRQGKPPTHPALLDYLARRFVAEGWSIKAMHRLILLSQTYQLASCEEPRNLEHDPANDYLWKFTRHRLDAESLRDALLAVSGSLDPTPGGAHPFPEQSTWDFTQHKPFKAVYETNRRSVYLMTQRIQRHPYLALFDGPDTNASTAARVTSTTPLQALYLMNDPFVHEAARKFAARLSVEAASEAARLDRAYRLAFGRPATAAEQAQAEQYLNQAQSQLASRAAAWESLCRALVLTNEFAYVE